jgi:hypothetical protein
MNELRKEFSRGSKREQLAGFVEFLTLILAVQGWRNQP